MVVVSDDLTHEFGTAYCQPTTALHSTHAGWLLRIPRLTSSRLALPREVLLQCRSHDMLQHDVGPGHRNHVDKQRT